MPKIVDHDLRRAEFAAASCAVIAEEGLGAATMRRVAERAGCTTGALTHYFPDRATLLTEALRAAHAAAGARMLAVVKRAAPPIDRLRGVLLEALPLDADRLREWRVWLAFWGATPSQPALAAENAARYVEWRGLLELLLGSLGLEPPERREEAHLLVALVDGLGLQLALQEAAAPAQRRECAARLERYLRRFERPATARG